MFGHPLLLCTRHWTRPERHSPSDPRNDQEQKLNITPSSSWQKLDTASTFSQGAIPQVARGDRRIHAGHARNAHSGPNGLLIRRFRSAFDSGATQPHVQGQGSLLLGPPCLPTA
jgi:hypothetical protein